jgi:glycosyltransferase involved in cell wall biosynthesis
MPVYDIILTCNYSPWSRYSGGAQKSVHMVATEMARQGLRVAALYSKAPWERIPGHSAPEYHEHWTGFFAFKPGISSPLRFLNGIFFFFKLLSLSSRHTVIHANGDEASLFGLLSGKRRFVYTNRYPEFPPFLYGRDWTRAGTWLAILFREPRFIAIAMGIRRADAVTVTSGYSRTEAAKVFGLRADRVSVVPNGVDPVFLELPIEGGPRRGVLFFGRLTRAKGADLALEAYARLPEDLKAAHPLRILGVGPMREELEGRAKALGLSQAEFPGWKRGEELAREIRASAAVCLPSREESFGNSVVEALALGLDLVSARAGSIPEVAGPWGVLAPAEDVAALAAGLEKALRQPMDPVRRESQREYVRSRYSWGRTALRFRSLYTAFRIGPPRKRAGYGARLPSPPPPPGPIAFASKE